MEGDMEEDTEVEVITKSLSEGRIFGDESEYEIQNKINQIHLWLLLLAMQRSKSLLDCSL